MNEESLFIEVLEVRDPAERAAYLDRACAGDAAARRRLERLLEQHDRAGNFLERPPLGTTRDFSPGEKTTVAHPREGAGTVIGPYKLLQQIGEGGMGTVFLAEQTEPIQRKVAVKIIKAGMDSRQVLARFEAERQALALMDHPNIARVLDAGTTVGGLPYFVMELVKGVPITRYCDDRRLACAERLGLFVQVCQAVQHAHQKGIIHRDIKPSNVMVCLYDGKPVPKVIDFGVAKATGAKLTDRTLFTEIGSVIGTLEYMSPEQAEVNQLDVDTRSDVYSLGVLLYELLTGTTPLERKRFKEVTFLEALRLIREEEPPWPSTRLSATQRRPTIAANRGLQPKRLSGLVRGELDWIVMRALDKDRNRRYETASALAADVERHLNDEPVQACPPSVGYRFRKFARRNKRAVATAATVAVAMLLAVVGLATSMVLIAREQQATQTAQQAEARAEDDRKKALERERRESYFHRITLAHRDGGLELLAECPVDLREWEWHYLMRLCKVEPLVLRDKAELKAVAFSPDGQRLASAGGDGFVKIWNSKTGDVVQTFPAHTGSVASVAFHPDGKHLASVGSDRKVKVWYLTSDQEVQEVFSGPCDAIRKFATAYTVAFSPDGRKLAAGSGGVVRVWDWKNDQVLHTFSGHEYHSISVAFSPDGRLLATGTFMEGVRLWDAEAGGLPLRTLPAHGHPITALAFSPDGERLASASIDKSVKLWDTTTGRLLHTLVHTGNVECVAFSSDGRRLASSGEDKTVRIWDATTGQEVLGLRGHTDTCACVAFSPDGRRLASASTDGTIRIWDATPLRGNEGQETLTFTQHSDEIYSVAFSPDGQRIASAGRDPVVKVWDAQTRQVSVKFSGHTVVVFCLAWHGHRIASAGSEGRLHTVRVWDARNGREAFAIPAGQEYFTVPFQTVAFSPDGKHLVTGKGNGDVQVWDAKTGQGGRTLGTHDREIRVVLFSPDGKHLASASGDGKVKLWDATRLDEKQEARLTLRARIPGPSSNVAFSPDGRRLATGGENNTVKIWDVQKGGELHTLRGHTGDVYTVAFSPDPGGRWIASAGGDSTVKIWDSHAGGPPIRNFLGHTGLVTSVAFSPDGRRLVSGSRDHTVKVWDVTQLKAVSDR